MAMQRTRPAHLTLLFVVRRWAGPCFLPYVVRWRPGLSHFPPWLGAEVAAHAMLTSLAGRCKELVTGEPRPRDVVGAVAGRWVASRPRPP